MSKDLEALKRIKEHLGDYKKHCEDLDTIEKELKALGIIKEKRVDFGILPYCLDLETYNNAIVVNGNEWLDYKPLTKEEYDLLKEVLK